MDKLFKELEAAQKALKKLDGELGTVQFDPTQPASVQAAITRMETMIDQKTSSFAQNPLVKELAQAVKSELAEQIRNEAASKRSSSAEEQYVDMDDKKIFFKKFENVIDDLRWSEYNTFDRHIKKLNALLQAEPFSEISESLKKQVDLDAWLKAGYDTQGGMVGSASLNWPESEEEEFGLIISLIEKFATEKQYVLEFCHMFYHKGSKINQELQFMSAQLLVPFSRDFIRHVKSKLGINIAYQDAPSIGASNRKIFIVHGHDDAAKNAMARYLEQMNFEAIILHEQPSQSRTIIENIEHHGDVGFAVVLLTPDDKVIAKGQEIYRARQNVIIELGYFIGRLGRERVSAFKKGAVEVPSDFNGVTYNELDDAGAWKQGLAKELKAAGFEINLNILVSK